MKKLLSFLIVCAMVLTNVAYAMPREYSITVYVDGEKIDSIK